MAAHPTIPTASRVAGNLWVGAAPPEGADLSRWHLTVLTAIEYQPRPDAFEAGRLLYVPLRDGGSRPTADEEALARAAGDAVAAELLRGRSVLVTCWLGRNRSALVAGLALRRAYGLSGPDVIRLIRDARGPAALGNPHFVRVLLAG